MYAPDVNVIYWIIHRPSHIVSHDTNSSNTADWAAHAGCQTGSQIIQSVCFTFNFWNHIRIETEKKQNINGILTME